MDCLSLRDRAGAKNCLRIKKRQNGKRISRRLVIMVKGKLHVRMRHLILIGLHNYVRQMTGELGLVGSLKKRKLP